MANSIPALFEAKQISLMSVQGQTVNGSGVLVPGTALDFADLGIFDRFTFDGEKNLFEYSPANAQVENYQRGKTTFNATISQFDKPGKVSALLDIYSTVDYVRIAAQAEDIFNGAEGKIFVVVAAVGNISTGWVEGKNATSLTLRPCGILPQWLAVPTI